jgi:hypothetical protein
MFLLGSSVQLSRLFILYQYFCPCFYKKIFIPSLRSTFVGFVYSEPPLRIFAREVGIIGWYDAPERAKNTLQVLTCVRTGLYFSGCSMKYYIHFDRQAQEGDLRRLQILTSDELSLPQDLRGPYDKLDDALKIAESLIDDIKVKILERLRTKKPKPFATFPTGGQRTEE